MSDNPNRQMRGDLLQIVLDSLTHPFYVIDVADYHVRLINAAARKLCNSEAATCHALAHRQDTPCHTEDHPCPLEIIKQTGKPTVVEHVHVDDQGHRRHVEVHGFPIFDEAGSLTQIIEYCVDITDRKRAMEGLHRFKLLSDHSRDIILFMRLDDGRILEANAAAVRSYGYSREELLTRTIHDLRAEHALDMTADQMSRADAQGILFETIHQRQDGSTFPVEVSSQGATVDGARTLISVVRDISERKEAEDALRESEGRFRTLSEAAFEGIAITEQGRIVDVNQTLVNMTGYTRSELIGASSLDLLFPDCPEIAEPHAVWGSEEPCEIVFRRKDGTTFIAEARGRASTYRGRPVRIGAITDITEHKRAEEALRESEQRFKSTFENAAVGIVHVALDGRFMRFNHRFVEIAGRPADELAQMTCSQLTHADDWETEQTQVQRLLDGQIHHYTIEKRYVRADGGASWVSLTRSLRRDDAGRPEYYIAFVQDISQRKHLEEELRQLNQGLEEEVRVRTEQLTTTVDRLQDEVAKRVTAEGRLRRRSQMLEGFFQHTITPLAFLDRNFTFVRVNEAYARADGRDPEYYIGKNHFDLYQDEETRTIFQQVVRGRQPYRAYARPFAYPDDPRKAPTSWNWLITPLLDERGQVEFLVFNLEDVTEQQQALQEVQERARQLQQLTLELSEAEDRERKRLAEILHDDLQQMLAAAKFHVGLLGNRVRSDADVYEMTRQIKELLSQAIDKSRSLSHELSPPVLGQSDLCQTFAWLAEHIQAKHGLAVQVEVCDPIEVHSEPLKAFLFKAAQEMLFNVIKHAQVKEARLRLQYRRGYINLLVADRGQGFDPQSLGRGGFGLLSIRERVKLLGGRMRIVSVPGRGSVFLIRVPAPQAPAAAGAQRIGEPSAAKMAAEKKRKERSAEPSLRILLVDDHKIVREGLEAMLIEERDIEVVGQAGNGREAVELAHQLQPDVIVMDVSMPVMAGDEATRQIKLHLPQIRIIALSMFDDPRTADRMRKAGAAAYLLKTAPSEELLTAIRGSESPSLVDNRV